LIDQSIIQLIKRSIQIDRSNWSIDRLINWSIDQLIDSSRSINWSINQF